MEAIISLDTKESESLKIIFNNKGEFLTNPKDIASFNIDFCSVAPTIQSNIKQTFKSFHYHLIEPCDKSFLMFPCTKKRILEIISSLYKSKATGINSISIKILKLTNELTIE